MRRAPPPPPLMGGVSGAATPSSLTGWQSDTAAVPAQQQLPLLGATLRLLPTCGGARGGLPPLPLGLCTAPQAPPLLPAFLGCPNGCTPHPALWSSSACTLQPAPQPEPGACFPELYAPPLPAGLRCPGSALSSMAGGSGPLCVPPCSARGDADAACVVTMTACEAGVLALHGSYQDCMLFFQYGHFVAPLYCFPALRTHYGLEAHNLCSRAPHPGSTASTRGGCGERNI